MRRAIYPGSFDPVTNGHLDIIERSCKLFDEIIIAIAVNQGKQPLFSIEERRAMISAALDEIDCSSCRIVVEAFEGLLMQYAVERGAHAILRGIRAVSDYEYELQMALMNRRIEPSIETVFLMSAEAYSYVSSRLVKEVYQLGAQVEGLVPLAVETRLKEKLQLPGRNIKMPRGDKSAYTDKQKRQAEHIEEGYEKRGASKDEAERRAWATVNKSSGGGKKSGSGRGQATNKGPAKKGGKKGGAASASRSAADKSASAKKAAATRARKKSGQGSGKKSASKKG